MRVEKILSQKETNKTVTVTADEPITAALRLLAEHKIGAVLVLGTSGDVAGILSERDIVRALEASGSTCLTQSISEIMTKDVRTCTLADRSEIVLEMMTKGRFRHLPVIDNGQLHGIISIGDVVKARLSEIEQENQALTDIITMA